MLTSSESAAAPAPRVLVLNQWLPPDPAPTAVLCGELIDELQAAGYSVLKLSRARGALDAARAPDADSCIIDRLRSGPTGILAKLSHWPRFAWRGWRLLRRQLRPGDLLVVSSDPPLFYILAIAAARSRGAQVVHWSQDLYPEVLESYWPSRLLRALLWQARALRARAVRSADRVVVISAVMQMRMRAAGARTQLIGNWARDDRLRARAPGESTLRRQYYSENDFVLAYSGNLGRVHEFDTLVAAANLLRDESGIRFLIVGNGPRLPALRATVAAQGLESAFRFLPLQPESALEDTLAAGDAHFVSLRPEFEGLVLPSKLYSIAAVGRPVLFCGAADGEVAQLLQEYGFGLAVACGDSVALAGAIRELARDRERCSSLGLRARAFIDQQHSRQAALAQWRALVADLFAGR